MTIMHNANWDLHQQFNSPVNYIFPAEEMEVLLHSFNGGGNYEFSETVIDPFASDVNYLFPENNYNYTINPCDQLEYYEPDQDFQLFGSNKRQKIYQDNYYYSDGIPALFDTIVPNPNLFQDFIVPEDMVHQGEYPSPPVYNAGTNACPACVKKSQPEKTLSAQSIAARQRRRKIADKTQELGKLVPGGQKMNTAEMFQAAFKYIKYLQAQVSLLECMGSFEDNGEQHHNQNLQALVASPFVQEKLYSTEKCLVPTNFIEDLANNHEIKSNGPVLKKVRQLIPT